MREQVLRSLRITTSNHFGADMEFIAGNANTAVPLSNRGFNYGDGIFTTIAVRGESIALQSLHQKRLQKGLDVLGIDAPIWPELWEFAQQMIGNSKHGDQRIVLKILISRGNGGRGYSTNGCSEAQAFFTLNGFPQHYDQWREQGISTQLSDVTLGLNPMLAGIKHCNRLEQVIARQHLDNDSDNDDHILCDIRENIIEASAGNIFAFIDNCWLTPDLTMAGVEGVLREWLLTEFFNDDSARVVSSLTQSDLFSAESLFVCNSLMGVVPVRQFEKQCYDVAPVHALVEAVQQHSQNVYF